MDGQKVNSEDSRARQREWARKLCLAGIDSGDPDPAIFDGSLTLATQLHGTFVKEGMTGLKAILPIMENNFPVLREWLADESPRFIHADDLHLLPKPEPLKGAEPLYKNGLNMLYGESGVGKSFLALHWALTVAQYAPVIYIAAEGAGGYDDRVKAWKAAHNKGSGALYFAPEELNIVKADTVDDFIASLQQFLDSVHQLSPQLVVIDTLARCFGDGNENDTGDMNRFVSGAARIQRALNAAVLIVHHTGWNTSRGRGNTALPGALDCNIELSDADGQLIVRNVKNKYGARAEDAHVRLGGVEGHSCLVIRPAEKMVDMPGQKPTRTQRLILETLALETFRETGAKSAVLKEVTSLKPDTLYKSLSTLKKLGYLVQGTKGDPFTITDLGLKMVQS